MNLLNPEWWLDGPEDLSFLNEEPIDEPIETFDEEEGE